MLLISLLRFKCHYILLVSLELLLQFILNQLRFLLDLPVKVALQLVQVYRSVRHSRFLPTALSWRDLLFERNAVTLAGVAALSMHEEVIERVRELWHLFS